jgi:FkbM family methyltransferase
VKSLIQTILRTVGYRVVRINEASKPSRNTNRLAYHETPTGNYYLPTDAHQDVIANTIIAGNLFEEPIIRAAQRHIKKGTTVLDVGSNYGQMAIQFAKMVGPDGHVQAFDADEFVYHLLQKNIKANSLDSRITANFGAVHDEADKTVIFPVQNFERFGAYGSYGIDPNATEGRTVRTITIDSLNIQDNISFMKFDVQGADLRAMKGAVETIARNRTPILFEYEYQFEEDYNFYFQDYVDFVRSIDYKFKNVISGHNFLIVPN